MKKLIAVLMLAGIALGQGRGPRRGSELYLLRDKYKLLTRQLKDTELKLAKAELSNSTLVFRYEWLCKCLGVDTAIVRNDLAWPAMRFTRPMRKGQKAFILAPDILTVYYVMSKDAVVMTLRVSGVLAEKVWLTGINTAGMKDGDRTSFTQPFKVTGTRIYMGESLYILEPTTLPEIKPTGKSV